MITEGEVWHGAIEEFFVFATLFLLGFGYLIACFNKNLAGGYYLFIFLGALAIFISRKLRKKKEKKIAEEKHIKSSEDLERLMSMLKPKEEINK